VAVTANGSSAATGQWQYFSGGVWTDVGAASDAAAKLFGDPFVTLFRFNPAPNFNGPAPTLTVHLIDNSLPFGIVNGQVVDISGPGATGGTTAYSTGTVVLSQSITAENDIPALDLDSTTPGNGFVAAYTENGAPVLIAPNALVSDVDSPNFSGGQLGVFFASNGQIGDSFSIISTGTGPGQISTSGNSVLYEGVVIATGVHGSGSIILNLNAQATSAGIQALLRQVAISSTRDSFAASSWNVTVELNDGDGGQFVLGSVFAAGVINIAAVNDQPTSTNVTINGVSEDDPYTFQMSDFPFNDVDGNAPFTVRFTSLPANGDILLNGVAIQVNDEIAYSAISAGMLTFQPDLDGFGSPYTTFTFQVRDNGGTANLGDDLSPQYTATINVAPDNLPPVVDLNGTGAGIDYSTTFIEDGAAVAIGAGLIVSDPDAGLGDLIESATVTLTDRVAGDALTLTGALPPGIVAVTSELAGSITIQITGPGTGAQYQALIQSILYATTNQDPTFGGTDLTRTITVIVNDGLVDSAVATTTVNITAVDDLPVAQPDAFTITESGSITAGNLFANNGSGADSDPDGPPLSISAVNGSGGNVGVQIALASGALLTVNANGTFDYNPNGAFLRTPTGGSGASNTPAHDSFTYTLAGGNTATVTITLTGLDTDDSLYGTAGVDVMFAGNGADYLDGLAGADQLHGQAGDDVYVVDDAGDQVFEAAGEGNDAVYTAVSYALGAGQSVETLAAANNAATTALALVGNELANTLLGNNGANFLDGGAGNDIMAGFGGDDIYAIDTAGDVVLEDAGAGNDAIYTTFTYQLGSGASVETLAARDNTSTAALALFGNELANTILGNNGANYLDGVGGADIMAGYSGDDAYAVDNAGDQVFEDAGRGNDIVYTSTSYGLAAGQSIETLAAQDNSLTTPLALVGNEIANTILGNSGANFLEGGGGADIMAGYGGDDVYAVDNGGDQVFENAGGGNDTVYTTASYTLGAGQSVEVLSARDSSLTTALDLTGNELDNTILGNAGSNVLDGKGGNDSLIGLAGADTFAFTTALGAGNVDVVFGFEHGVDRIALDDAVFTAIGALGTLNAFATLNPGLTLTATDFTVI
jgi:hypothetical protein